MVKWWEGPILSNMKAMKKKIREWTDNGLYDGKMKNNFFHWRSYLPPRGSLGQKCPNLGYFFVVFSDLGKFLRIFGF